MKIEEAFARFLNAECLVYTVESGDLSGNPLQCTLEEIGEGYIRISQGKERNESIVNIRNIIRIREYPTNKNGKKKLVFD